MNDTHVDPYYLEDYVSLFDLYKLSLTPPTEARPCVRNGADFNWTCVPEAGMGKDHGPPMTLAHLQSPYLTCGLFPILVMVYRGPAARPLPSIKKDWFSNSILGDNARAASARRDPREVCIRPTHAALPALPSFLTTARPASEVGRITLRVKKAGWANTRHVRPRGKAITSRFGAEMVLCIAAAGMRA